MPHLDEFRCDARENVKIIKRTLRRGRGYKTNDAIARLAQLVRHTRSDTARVASSRERGAGGRDHYALFLSLSLSLGFLLALKAEFVPGRSRGRFAGETARPK